MAKIYLQEKITPVTNKYIVIGTDGNLTTGDLPTGVYPEIYITFPEGTTGISAHCGNLVAEVTIISNTTAYCSVKQFGTWIISGFYNNNLISDSILVSEITSYDVQLRYIPVTPDVYDLTTNPDLSNLKSNDVLNCDYSGNYVSATLPAGTYQLECWGASGGNAYSSIIDSRTLGGNGGYSKAVLTSNASQMLYLYVGQKGFEAGTILASSTYAYGPSISAFNGGGAIYRLASGIAALPIASGGGATDIRFSPDLGSRIIIAGGGGGGYSKNYDYGTVYAPGGYGGGNIAGDGTRTVEANGQAKGATTYTSGKGSDAGVTDGSLGVGGTGAIISGTICSFGGSGGGGYFGGGAGIYGSGAGGSAYVSPLLDNIVILDGTTSITEPDGVESTGHIGNGYIRITVLSLVGE